MFGPSAEAEAQMQGSCFSAETLLETLLFSPFQQHRKHAVASFNSMLFLLLKHCYIATIREYLAKDTELH